MEPMTTTSRLLCLAGLSVGAALLTIQESAALSTRHDVAASEYVVKSSDYPAVIDLFEPGDCLGTLVDDRHLLTVAHCAKDTKNKDVLKIGGTRHGVDAVFMHPDWNGWKNDIAMIRLTKAVDGVSPFAVYRDRDEEGQKLTLVGRGMYATGLGGEKDAVEDGVLRRATNVVTSASKQWLEVYFDRPNSGRATDLEGVGLSGDSGGPAFLWTEDGWVIAGLNSWGEGDGSAKLGQYGAWDYSTRVSSHVDWIDCVLGPQDSGDTGNENESTGSASNVECPQRKCGCSTTGGANNLWASLPVMLLGLLRRRP